MPEFEPLLDLFLDGDVTDAQAETLLRDGYPIGASDGSLGWQFLSDVVAHDE